METNETAKTKTQKTKAAKQAEAFDVNAYLQEPVSVFLMKDDLRYTDDVTVTYNGVNYQVKRGVPVEVPRFIKLILDDSFRQKTAAAEFSKQLEDSFYFKTERVQRGQKAG